MIAYLISALGAVGFFGIGVRLLNWATSDRAKGHPDRIHAAIFGIAALMIAAMVGGALIAEATS